MSFKKFKAYKLNKWEKLEIQDVGIIIDFWWKKNMKEDILRDPKGPGLVTGLSRSDWWLDLILNAFSNLDDFILLWNTLLLTLRIEADDFTFRFCLRHFALHSTKGSYEAIRGESHRLVTPPITSLSSYWLCFVNTTKQSSCKKDSKSLEQSLQRPCLQFSIGKDYLRSLEKYCTKAKPAPSVFLLQIFLM